MYQVIASVFWRASSTISFALGSFALGRRRRKDDAIFAAVGAALALFFLIELGWVIVHQSHPDLL